MQYEETSGKIRDEFVISRTTEENKEMDKQKDEPQKE